LVSKNNYKIYNILLYLSIYLFRDLFSYLSNMYYLQEKVISINMSLIIITFMCFGLTKGNPNFFENKQFTTNPGIYFENISPLHIAISQWNFLIF